MNDFNIISTNYVIQAGGYIQCYRERKVAGKIKKKKICYC